jgi:hypothetical protein
MAIGKQRFLVWLGLVLTVIYAVALGLLLHMIPPPSPNQSALQVAAWYREKADSIRLGATIGTWSGGCMIPFFVTIVMQMARQETGRKVWTLLTAASGPFLTIFLCLPPIFFGAAAFTPQRSPDATQLMHQLGVLTLVTTDQIYIFAWIAIIALCLSKTTLDNPPFPRWFGYFTAWTACMFEAGAVGYLTKTGPFSWRGLLVYWSPVVIFGVWVAVAAVVMMKALNAQESQPDAPPATTITAIPNLT